jgi:hypothetical protein
VTGWRTQVDALARAFCARFFESEITAGADDMKRTFFWLLAAVSMPGIMIPVLMSFDWEVLALMHGWEGVRVASMNEKAFYLGVSMLSAGGLTAIAWTSVLPDRRDTLILGALPVEPRVVIAAKLAALAVYIGIIAAGTHVAGTLIWASLLGNHAPFWFMVRSFPAHLLASFAITATTALAIAAAQGVTLTILGPRLYQRASTVLQVFVVALLAIFLAMLPVIGSSAAHTISGGPRAQPWLLSLPPMWFLGLYESILGTSDPLLRLLALRAMIAMGVSGALVLVTYPLAYQRLMVSVVEAGHRDRGFVARTWQAILVGVSGRRPAARAAAEFFVATIERVERHRFIVAITLGLAVAWSLPGLRAYTPSPAPSASLLSLPIAIMMFLLAGLRVASVLPADPRAAWVFEVHDLSRADARQALERMMIALGIAPPVLASTAVCWYLWGAIPAATHALVMIALGVATLELLIWHCNGMPCGQQWTPARMGFGRRWPLHMGVFLLVVLGVPRLEVLLFGSYTGCAIFIGTLVVLAAAVRYASARHEIVPVYEDVDPVAGVLRIT